MTRTFTRALEDLGHEWILVDRRFSRSIAEVHRFQIRKLVLAFWMPFRLLLRIVQFRPDATVFYATTSTFSFLVDWILSEILRRSPTPVIIYLHTVGFKQIAARGRIWAWLVKRLLQSGDSVVTLGPSLAFDLAPWVGANDISFIANTADESQATDEEPVNEDQSSNTILYLSNLIPEKGADIFIDTAISIDKKIINARFVLAGAPADPNFLNALQAQVSSSGLTSRFDFRGAVVNPVSKWQMIQKSTVLAFTSTLFEAQPLTILEALSVGTPVVAFDVGGVRDILRDGIDGILVARGDREAFATALISGSEFGADNRRREAIREGYYTRFSQKVYAQNWSRVLAKTTRNGDAENTVMY